MKKIRDYNFSLDVIRTLGIIGVVIIHTANSVFERPDFFGGISWWFSIILDSISRICIPLFIMISGYLLLKKEEKYTSTLKRIVNRLVIPLLFWTVLNYLLANPDSRQYVLTWPFYLRFFSGNVSYFYFLIILIGLYFVSPLFINFVKNASIKSQKYLAYIFIVVGVLETAEEYLSKNCAVENSFTKWVPYAGLFLIGYLIGTKKIRVLRKPLLTGIYLLGLASTIALNYVYYAAGSINILRALPTGCLSHYSDHYLAINVVLMAVPAFALLFDANYKAIRNTIWEKIIFSIARASFGIYLVHLLFVFILDVWDWGLNWTVDETRLPLWLYILVKLLGVFTVSYILVLGIRKVPILKKTIGE